MMGSFLVFFYILDETDEFSKSGLSTSHCACVLNEKALLPSAVFANLQSLSSIEEPRPRSRPRSSALHGRL